MFVCDMRIMTTRSARTNGDRMSFLIIVYIMTERFYFTNIDNSCFCTKMVSIIVPLLIIKWPSSLESAQATTITVCRALFIMIISVWSSVLETQDIMLHLYRWIQNWLVLLVLQYHDLLSHNRRKNERNVVAMTGLRIWLKTHPQRGQTQI